MSEVKIATRESYGNALVELGGEHENLVVLDADLAAATKTGMFKKAFPDRHIDCGIAEANMTGVAAGMSHVDLYRLEHLRHVCGRTFLRAGAQFHRISASECEDRCDTCRNFRREDGATHQCNEDIALMRAIPGMVVINPADDIEARAAVKAAYEYVGPVYLRFGRLAVPVINDGADYKFEIGKGVTLVREATAPSLQPDFVSRKHWQQRIRWQSRAFMRKSSTFIIIKPLDEELVVKTAKRRGVYSRWKSIPSSEDSALQWRRRSVKNARQRLPESVSTMSLANPVRQKNFFTNTDWMQRESQTASCVR